MIAEENDYNVDDYQMSKSSKQFNEDFIGFELSRDPALGPENPSKMAFVAEGPGLFSVVAWALEGRGKSIEGKGKERKASPSNLSSETSKVDPESVLNPIRSDAPDKDAVTAASVTVAATTIPFRAAEAAAHNYKSAICHPEIRKWQSLLYTCGCVVSGRPCSLYLSCEHLCLSARVPLPGMFGMTFGKEAWWLGDIVWVNWGAGGAKGSGKRLTAPERRETSAERTSGSIVSSVSVGLYARVDGQCGRELVLFPVTSDCDRLGSVLLEAWEMFLGIPPGP